MAVVCERNTNYLGIFRLAARALFDGSRHCIYANKPKDVGFRKGTIHSEREPRA